MAESASSAQPRTFTRKDGDKVLTRVVTSPEGETAALFDGYTEEKTSKTSGGSRSSGSSSS